ncbi:sodium:dicarboxylate symporter [Minicystis rosea]|nr:sodium:dicarboxylate symporter [Minicystis rosea]
MVCTTWKGCAVVSGNEQDGWFVDEGAQVSRGAVAGVRNVCHVDGPCEAATVAEPGVVCPPQTATPPIRPPPYTCVLREGRCEEVPTPAPPPAPPSLPSAPDRSALRDLLTAAQEKCKPPGTSLAPGRVVLTMAPSGAVTRVDVRPPHAGTPAGACLAAALRTARVPPFSGHEVTVEARIGVP